MLTTSTILMSLGSEMPNVPQISSDRTDAPSISFAESFDKNASSKNEIELQPDSGKKMKDDCEAKQIVPPIKMDGVDLAGIKMKMGASGGVNIKEKYKNINDSVVSTKTTLAPTITTETFSGNKSSHEDVLMAIKAEIANSQLPSGNVKGVEQKVVPEITNSNIPVSADQANDSKIEVATSATPSVSSTGVTTIAKNQNEILISNKNGNVIPSKKVAKGHDDIAKTEKLAKLKDKTSNIVEPMGNLIEAGQKGIVIPGLTLQVDTQQHSSNLEQNDFLSSFGLEAPERSIEVKPMLVSKFDQKTAVAAGIDGDNTKPSILSIDDSSSQKVGADLPRQGLPAPSMMDGDGTKAQSVVTAGVAAGLTHDEPGIVATAFGGVGIMAAPGVAPKTLMAEASSHPANIHADSHMIDASGAIDVTHQTLMATPTSLEVGVANGTHGWLKIRAEMTVGGVNASLSSATSSGQEMLHRELPSLTAYLQSEHVAVSTVVLQPAIVPGANSQQFASGMNDGGRGQAPQSDGQGGQQNRQDASSAATNHLERDESYRDARKDKLLPPVSYARGGRWLNVRA